MPTPAASADAAARLDGDTLRLSGRLDRAGLPALWAALPAHGYARLDLTRVAVLDTAGLALIAELAERARAAGRTLAIDHPPAGYAELCAAYRIAPEQD